MQNNKDENIQENICQDNTEFNDDSERDYCDYVDVDDESNLEHDETVKTEQIENNENKDSQHQNTQESNSHNKSDICAHKKPFVTKKTFILCLIFTIIFTSYASIFTSLYIFENYKTNNFKNNVSEHYNLENATNSKKSIQEIISMNEYSVVEIKTEYTSKDFFMREQTNTGAGSGVIISEDGYILTCYHIIEDTDKTYVTIKDGATMDAELIGYDKSNDIAVLKISGKNFKKVVQGDSDDLLVGDLSVVIGNPLGQLGGTATQGIISALDREITIDGHTYNLLQTDASVSPGNSGGGMFNQYGELIGIITAKSSGLGVEGLGFATPSNKAFQIANDIIKNGGSVEQKHTGIGITVIDVLDAQTAIEYGVRNVGVYVYEVTSPLAKKAGIKPGDMIYYAGNKKIETSEDLYAILDNEKPGNKLELTVIRDNEIIDIETELIEIER